MISIILIAIGLILMIFDQYKVIGKKVLKVGLYILLAEFVLLIIGLGVCFYLVSTS